MVLIVLTGVTICVVLKGTGLVVIVVRMFVVGKSWVIKPGACVVAAEVTVLTVAVAMTVFKVLEGVLVVVTVVLEFDITVFVLGSRVDFIVVGMVISTVSLFSWKFCFTETKLKSKIFFYKIQQLQRKTLFCTKFFSMVFHPKCFYSSTLFQFQC